MTSLLLVGDGPLDGAILPSIVSKIVGDSIEGSFSSWKSITLSHGHGYDRKIKYFIRRAVARRLSGVVAVIDRDKDRSGKRVKALRKTRNEEKANPHYRPTAIGEARPHGEAWLLADAEAVKMGLGLPAEAEVPSPRNVGSPKETLTALHQEGERSDEPRMEVWKRISEALEPDKCRHSNSTGFDAFRAEVGVEIGPLCALE